MKIVAATLGINDPFIDNDDMDKFAYWNAEYFQKSTGITPHVLEDGLLKHGIKNPYYFNIVTSIKFLLFDIFPDADRIIYFDADLRFVRKFNLWDYIPNESGVYVVKARDKTQYLKAKYELKNDYFNNGFFVVDREYAALLKYCHMHFNDFEGVWYDQCVMNQVFDGFATFIDDRLNQRDLGKYPNSEILGYHNGENYQIYLGNKKDHDWST